jgi:predicted CXXCH cytochrome family protein
MNCNSTKTTILLFFVVSLFLSYILAYAAGVSGTKHDLTTPTTTDPCIFCHTWRNPAPGISPAWNRNISNLGAFIMYSSQTMKTSTGIQPGSYSLACLTCHDDAGASSAVNYTDTHKLRSDANSSTPSSPNCSKCHAGGSGPSGLNPHFIIGPDLRDDHPISMSYPTNLPEFFNLPPDFSAGWTDVKLYSGKVECGSCHDPHDATRGMFLRKSNTGSALCTTCHRK